MATRGDETSDLSSINPIVPTEDAGRENQPADIPDLNRIRIDHNYNVGANMVRLNCVVPECEYVTQECSEYDQAYGLLNMHLDWQHKKQPSEDKERHTNKILVPEKLELIRQKITLKSSTSGWQGSCHI